MKLIFPLGRFCSLFIISGGIFSVAWEEEAVVLKLVARTVSAKGQCWVMKLGGLLFLFYLLFTMFFYEDLYLEIRTRGIIFYYATRSTGGP